MVKILNTVTSKMGNKIDLTGEPSESGNALIIGVFHGDEPQGKYLIDEYLKKGEIPTGLLFIPCLNPDGMAKNTRTNANGVDINRNFPTKNWGGNEGENATCSDITTAYFGGSCPSSEIETQFLIDTIEKYPIKSILTIHSPYRVVNYDGPAKELAQKISDIIHYPVEASIGYPTPGSFGTYCGVERNIPIVTLELDDKRPVENLVDPMFEIFDMLSRND